MRVLVVDDEPQIRRALRRALEAEGLAVQTVPDGEEALDVVAAIPPDLVVLDLGLPGVSGLDVIRDLRRWSQVPVLVLSVIDDEASKVAALQAGADDYVTKPFSVPEVIARVHVQLRRSSGLAGGEPVIDAGDVCIDLHRRIVTRDGEEVHLTPLEYSLLAYLARNAGRVMTHQMILSNVWGAGYGDSGHYVRLYVSQLRRKLETDPDRPRLIRTETGVGYRFEPSR